MAHFVEPEGHLPQQAVIVVILKSSVMASFN